MTVEIYDKLTFQNHSRKASEGIRSELSLVLQFSDDVTSVETECKADRQTVNAQLAPTDRQTDRTDRLDCVIFICI